VAKTGRSAKSRSKVTKSRTAGKRRKQGQLIDAVPSSLRAWFDGLQAVATANESTSPRGSCLVADPAGGPAHCISTDATTCRAIKGAFTLGGSC